MKKYLVILFLFVGLITYGQDKNYYVSMTNGDDSRSTAQAQNILTPWKTLAKLQSTITFQGDDSARLHRGSEWKEEFKPLGDGTDGHNVVITAYGTGAKPIITALDTITGWSRDANWTPHATNVWKIPLLRDGAYTHRRLWIDGEEKQTASSVANISVSRPWYYNLTLSATDSILYVYSVGNPGSVYDSIQSNKGRRTCITLDNDSYFTISYLDLQHGFVSLWNNESDGTVADSCRMSGWYGEAFYGSGGDYSENCEVKNCVFDSQGLATTGYTYNPRYTEDAIRFTGGVDGVNVHDNYVTNYGHASLAMVQIVDDAINERIDNILVYDNYFTSPDLDYGGRIEVDYIHSTGVKIYRNKIQNTSVSNQFNGENLEFYYNIIDTIKASTYSVGTAIGINVSGYNGNTTPNNMKFYNNVIAHTGASAIYISWYAGRAAIHDNEFVNNIVYNPGNYGISIMNESSIYSNNFENNIIYKSGSSTPINYRSVIMSVAMFNSADSEQDTISNNNGDSPQFTTGTFELSALSTNAINQGKDVSLTSDYKQQALIGLPDIGAYEYYYDETIVGPFVFGKNSSKKFLKTSRGSLIKIVQ